MNEMQNEFPNARNVCYLNSASEGLLPQRSLKAMIQAAELKQAPQVLGNAHYFELPSRIRELLGNLLHCSSSETALVPSTSFGLGAVAFSLPLKSGDEVLLVERDFPSNNFAWECLRSQGIQIRTIAFTPDNHQTSRLLEAIKPQTRVVSISVVHFYTGFRYDLAAISELCRRKDVFLVVDGIQAFGNSVIDLQQTPVDALCAAGHKWQLSPSGTGVLYIHRDLMPRLKHSFTGWMHNKNATAFSNTSMFEYEPCSTTRRFELGTAPYILYAAYEQSLQLLQESRIEYIEQHNRRLVSKLVDFFCEMNWDVPDIPRSSSIFSVSAPAQCDIYRILNKLAERQVYVSVRENHLRIAPHFYNTEQDIDRFCQELRTCLG